MNSSTADRKDALLKAAARAITGNRDKEQICGKRPFDFLRWPDTDQYTRRKSSYVVGTIDLLPGLDARRALDAYSDDNAAVVVQLLRAVGWHIPKKQAPEVQLTADGVLRITTPWPGELQENDVPMSHLSATMDLPSIWRQGRVVIGPDVDGDVLTMTFSHTKTRYDSAHHGLVGGASGSGKSWFIKFLIYQIIQQHLLIEDPARCPQLVNIDGKGGEGSGYLRNVPGQVGPVAIDSLSETQAALAWVFNECRTRYRRMEESGAQQCPDPPLYVFFSEFTKFTADDIGVRDPAVIFMLANLAQQGRAANIHLILDTQYPKASAFGDSAVRKQLDFTVCMRTADQYDTLALLPPGTNLRPYQTLTLPGHCYALLGGYPRNVLASYAPPVELAKMRDSAAPQMAAWPEFDASSLEGFEAPKDRGQPPKSFTAAQLALAASFWRNPPDKGDKRSALAALLKRETGEGLANNRAGELLELGRELCAELDAQGFCREE